jgi:serine/threonine protein kinase
LYCNTGEVYKGKWLSTTVACKLLKGQSLEVLYNEGLSLSACHHPHILPIYGIARFNRSQGVVWALVLECAQGSLVDETLSHDQIVDIALQICKAMIWVHSLGMIHRYEQVIESTTRE